jgi:hypothetical protein
LIGRSVDQPIDIERDTFCRIRQISPTLTQLQSTEDNTVCGTWAAIDFGSTASRFPAAMTNVEQNRSKQ